MTKWKRRNTWASKTLKRKLKQAMAHNEDRANIDLQKMNNALKSMDANQDKDISDMEDEGEQDIDIDDKSIEANTVHNEHKFSALESNPVPSTNSFKNYLNLPDIPFTLLMKMLTITDLQRLTQVSSSLKYRIMETFLNNPVNQKTSPTFSALLSSSTPTSSRKNCVQRNGLMRTP